MGVSYVCMGGKGEAIPKMDPRFCTGDSVDGAVI